MLQFKIAYPGHRNNKISWKTFFLFEVYVKNTLVWCVFSHHRNNTSNNKSLCTLCMLWSEISFLGLCCLQILFLQIQSWCEFSFFQFSKALLKFSIHQTHLWTSTSLTEELPFLRTCITVHLCKDIKKTNPHTWSHTYTNTYCREMNFKA